VIDEATAYCAAWQRGDPWPVGPSPIPMNYATRAGALWRAGEAYRFDPLAGLPPNCWGPAIVRPLYVAAAGEMLPPVPREANTIESALPRVYTSGVPVLVTLKATPEPAAVTYAIEECPPKGWSVSDVTEGGSLDGKNNTVKWVFMDNVQRKLQYTATPPAGALGVVRFEGRGSFDVPQRGVQVPVIGQRFTASEGTGLPRLCAIIRQADGTVALRIEGEAGARVVLEISDDLALWRLVDVVTNETGRIEYIVPADAASTGRFYRVRAEDNN
jgi:hypothetical protein